MTLRSVKYIVSATFSVSILIFSCEKFNLESFPDLIVKSTNVIPTQVSVGGNISVSCQVKNQGNADADFPLSQFDGLYYFFSDNTTWEVGDPLLSTSNINDIAAGKSQDILGNSLTIPTGIIPGNYYILFYIDKDDDIEELNENNNVSSIMIKVIN